MKKRTVKLCLQDTDGNMHGIYLQNALYAPSYKQNIFSVQAATEKGVIINFSSDKASYTARKGTKFDINKKDYLYYLNKCKAESVKLVNHDLWWIWHQIFGHCNIQDVLKLPAVVKGMNITDKTSKICETCTLGKMTEFRSRLPDEKAKLPLELVHCTLAGPVDPVSI